MKFYGAKNISLKNADCHLHYANNKGRGSNNVTVTLVEKNAERPMYTSKYKEYLLQYRVCGWRGIVNISNDVINNFGGLI